MRRAVHDALEAAQVGEVVDTGAGMGVMDIYLEVDDVASALREATMIVKRLGLADRTSVAEASAED